MVYVESNFLLEIAFTQQDAAAAETILRLAEDSSIVLAVPAVALVEPFATIRYRNSERREVLDSWSHMMNRLKPNRLSDLGLFAPKQHLDAGMVDAYGDAADLVRQQSSLLNQMVDRVLGVAKILPFGATEMRRALSYRELGLDTVDSLIFAIIITHLEQANPSDVSCFVSRDKKGFANQDISAELSFHGSRYISTFTNALAYIQSSAPTEESPT